MSKAPYPLKDSFLNLDQDEMDKVVWSALQLESEIQWRWPEPGKIIYHHPAVGFISIWL